MMMMTTAVRRISRRVDSIIGDGPLVAREIV
jgi:hypothetical protein